MKTLIIDNGTRHLGKLKELLFGQELEIMPLFRKYPVSGFDLLILSGGSQYSIASAPEIFSEEEKLIKSSQIPMVGICEGCEMIAYAFGSKLEHVKSIKGLKKIELLYDDPLFKGFENIKVYESHRWSVTKLGKDLIGIAKSNTGYEIIKHKNKMIYGLQFHPEMFADKTLGNEIFTNIFSKIKGEVQPKIE